MSKLTRRIALSLMAHPDDCEFQCAGTLALLARKGWEVHIVTMAPGDCGSMEHPPEAISAIRRKEAAAAAAVIGAEYHCLEARDAYMMFDDPTVRKAVSLLRGIGPSLVFTHSLDDYMMDHEITARVARAATFAFGIPNAAPGPVPKGAGIPWLYYAPPMEGIDIYGRPVASTTFVDIGAAMKAKEKMLKCHASQRDWLLKHHGVDEYVNSLKHWAVEHGRVAGVKFAEAFRQHRGHAYPRDCVLQQELGDLVHTTNA